MTPRLGTAICVEGSCMKRSVDRVLTTHTGSLPRPTDLLPLLFAKEDAEAVDTDALEQTIRRAVADVVRQQAELGVDVLNDGEMGKISYATYIHERLTGFEGQGAMPSPADIVDFPEFGQRMFQGSEEVLKHWHPLACSGPIAVKDREQVRRDIQNLKAATEAVQVEDVFMSAASPGVIALFFPNQYYPTREAYLAAIADAMQEEYEAIAQSGIVLQVDCPDLAMGRHIQFNDEDLEGFRRQAQLNVEALNHATRNIPSDQMRMHICWGNYEGPHHKDVALKDIIDIVFSARPSAISIEACNPRHEHEWQLFEEVALPDGKLLMPGVIDSTNNYIEHPELIAQRIARYARLVGQENVIAGSDCGFGTGAGMAVVDPKIVWAKLQAMAEGARLATQQLRLPAHA
jgi:5-methyltetrahydropteroyltriglutamate--homocysteine methyltransferase